MTPAGTAFVPAHMMVGVPVKQARRFTIIVHGILGSGRHWRSFARALSEGSDEAFALVDLRGHGNSHGAPEPHTVEACARDLVRLEAALGRPADRVIGHSFGGKVALVYGLRMDRIVEEVWCLDSPPGARPGEVDPGRGQIREVLAAVAQIGLPAPARGPVVEELRRLGMPPAVAGWMGTNLTVSPDTGGLVWAFDKTVAWPLLDDYFVQDLWPDIREVDPSCRVHLVRAELSDRWGPAELRRLQMVKSDGLASVHVLPNAGHWLHVDNAGGLKALLQGRLGHGF